MSEAKKRGDLERYRRPRKSLSEERNLRAGRHNAGDLQVDDHWKDAFEPKFSVARLKAVITFSDALNNTYYRSDRYHGTGDSAGPRRLGASRTYTTGLTPAPKYTLSNEGNGNVVLVPENVAYASLENLVSEDVPTPVRKFNEAAPGSTAGIVFGD